MTKKTKSQLVKSEITKMFPDLTFSVTGGYATYTPQITISITAIKNSFLNPFEGLEYKTSFINEDETTQKNGLTSYRPAQLAKGEEIPLRHTELTGKLLEVYNEILKVIEKHYGNFKAGDSMFDELDNYFFDINLGKWNKELKFNGKNISEYFTPAIEYKEDFENFNRSIYTNEEINNIEFDSFYTDYPEKVKNYFINKLAAKKQNNTTTKTTHAKREPISYIFTAKTGTYTAKNGDVWNTLILTETVPKNEWKDFIAMLKAEGIGFYNSKAKAILTDKVETPTPTASEPTETTQKKNNLTNANAKQTTIKGVLVPNLFTQKEEKTEKEAKLFFKSSLQLETTNAQLLVGM